jgi:hypothetical protein
MKRAASLGRLALCSTLVLQVLNVACRPSPPPLANTQASPAALANLVLIALEKRDAAALRALALDEQEFREHVWPELPAARPERNLPLSYVWGDLHQKSEASLAATLGSHGGQHFEFVGVRFLGRSTQYETYLVHRETVVIVKDGNGGTLELQLFGSTLEKNGRFKVFSYVVDR